ncbi:Outer membrane protein A [Buchnera aphidicola (Eriosoma grossulariae)]|uniref:OmpA family protein n=1 Tax=Buchnera aphidicola TaxID=9 RepID=UPI00346494CB
MKYSVFCIIFLLFFSFTVEAHENNESALYLGSKLNLYDFNFSVHPELLKKKHNINKFINKIPISFILGYEQNPYLSFEFCYDSIGYKNYNQNINQIKLNTINLSSGIKFSYPISSRFSIYNRIGSEINSNININKNLFGKILHNKIKIMPIFSIGIKKEIINNISYQLDYSWKKDLLNLKYNDLIKFKDGLLHNELFKNGLLHNRLFKNGLLSMSLIFKFKNINDYNNEFKNSFIMHPLKNIKETILFPFGSAQLNSSSKMALEKLNSKIKKMNFSSVKYNITGYIDQYGNKDINKNLSRDRIKSVIKYLTKRGVLKKYINEKELEEKSLVNQFCKNIQQKPLLMSCLAPDRRVEINVHGK